MFEIKREIAALGFAKPKLEKIDDLVYQFKLDLLQVLKERKNSEIVKIKTSMRI